MKRFAEPPYLATTHEAAMANPGGGEAGRRGGSWREGGRGRICSKIAPVVGAGEVGWFDSRAGS